VFCLDEELCRGEPLTGDCTEYTERYYYDLYEGRCKPFVYSGCGGNLNNFANLDDCSSRCESQRQSGQVLPSPVFDEGKLFI